ncbi:hypothetical protein NG895_08365 [Aeoliella sp. ICT_H6.2]|uniref:Uncharacterized protein n=1 Tax=Aeoliella straminimaris TaxID=2954799 RepID=A0A9X2JGT7_9BACT|nr:hypothetical protein [Aeoliella straminimaris]MCO6043918.1 hypothetical protein [Aeoliella straminimaris]
MSRIRLVASTCLIVLTAAGALHAEQPADHVALRTELAELKSLAEQLQARIAKLEERLAPPMRPSDLRLIRQNDALVVYFASPIQNPGVTSEMRRIPGGKRLVPTIMATVEDILPNGDCVLSGPARYEVDGVRYEGVLTGVAPRNAIGPSRNIRAKDVRDLKIDVRQSIAN